MNKTFFVFLGSFLNQFNNYELATETIEIRSKNEIKIALRNKQKKYFVLAELIEGGKNGNFYLVTFGSEENNPNARLLYVKFYEIDQTNVDGFSEMIFNALMCGTFKLDDTPEPKKEELVQVNINEQSEKQAREYMAVKKYVERYCDGRKSEAFVTDCIEATLSILRYKLNFHDFHKEYLYTEDSGFINTVQSAVNNLSCPMQTKILEHKKPTYANIKLYIETSFKVQLKTILEPKGTVVEFMNDVIYSVLLILNDQIGIDFIKRARPNCDETFISIVKQTSEYFSEYKNNTGINFYAIVREAIRETSHVRKT